MRAWVIKAGRQYVDHAEDLGPLNTAWLFPTKKEAKNEVLDDNERVVSVEIVEVTK